MFWVNKDCEQGTAEEWTNLLDRVGLWHVRETTFQVLFIRREGVRQFLLELSSPAAATGLKAEFVAKLVTNDDVQFHWSIATAAFDVLMTLKYMKLYSERLLNFT